MSNRSKRSEWERIEWLKTGEAADVLGISKNTLKRLVREDYIKAYHVKGVRGWQFKLEDVLSLLQQVKPEEIDEGSG